VPVVVAREGVVLDVAQRRVLDVSGASGDRAQ